MKFIKADKNLFFSKNDPHDPRLGDYIKFFEEKSSLENSFVIIGYPDDAGIKLNGGRPGAGLAPTALRKFFYRLTPGLNKETPSLLDYGDLEIVGTLDDRHLVAHDSVKNLLSQKANVMVLGGGHDYGYPDFSAFIENTLTQGLRPFIVNFDAHLDVRPDKMGPHSGTPFYRLLNQYSKDVDFFEVGIQEWCNSSEHLSWAKARGTHVITLNEILNSEKSLKDFLNHRVWSKVQSHHSVGLSVDIDAFESGCCPGASQVFPIGLKGNDFMHSWQDAINRFKPKLMAIYEVSPPFDLDDKTSKFAALLLHQFIFARS